MLLEIDLGVSGVLGTEGSTRHVPIYCTERPLCS